jgi:peptide/nickel transport system substrate-binding protein
MGRIRRITLATLGVALVVLFAAACGSSSKNTTAAGGTTGGTTGTTGTTGSAPGSIPTRGPGLTEATAPTGAKVAGGTVYFTQGPDAPPSYIFPLYTFADCSTTNINQFMDIMYRPLYWYGNNYSPTIDYDYSIGQAPVYSNGDTTVTLKLNSWKWSDGEPVSSRDLEFWMNVIKASPATEWCGYAAGYFPDNVKSYSAPDPTTFVMHLNKAYDPEWVTYSLLSQITPMPLSWDRTSLAGCTTTCPAPSGTASLPDSTKSGASAVYKFLDGQGKKLASAATSPLWSVVDGPFKLGSFSADGEATLVPNTNFSGSPKPQIAKLVELPFTSEAAIYNQMKSGGPSVITIGNIPAQYAPQAASLASQGYTINKAASYSFNYFPLNFNTSGATSPGGEPVRYVFRQPYFREAFQHLIDQPGWINAFLNHTAIETCGPIPVSPSSPLVSAAAVSSAPCAFDVSAAQKLLTDNGWKVASGGTTTCVKPGTAAGDCGSGINQGEGISFTLDYESGVVAVQNEMNDLAANAKKIGIAISLTTHPFQTVVASAVPCTPSQATCKWEANNWGAGWIYGPSYLPTGEPLYNPGSAANAGSYVDPSGKMPSLIAATITGPLAQESSAIATYASYVSTQVPVVFGPTSIGTYAGDAGTAVDSKLGGYAANALGLMNPEDWYLTK